MALSLKQAVRKTAMQAMLMRERFESGHAYNPVAHTGTRKTPIPPMRRLRGRGPPRIAAG